MPKAAPKRVFPTVDTLDAYQAMQLRFSRLASQRFPARRLEPLLAEIRKS